MKNKLLILKAASKSPGIHRVKQQRNGKYDREVEKIFQ